MTQESSAGRDRELIRILVVEDKDFEAELTARMLRKHEIEHLMQRVATEEQMRASLRDFKPAIILSDFTLPQFDGLSALAVARECAPELPFIFVSGTIGEEVAIDALRRGAMDYVLKSNLQRLAPAVKRALREAAAWQVRQRQEQQIARLNGVLRMLSGINATVIRSRRRGELLREACRLAVAVGGYPTAVVALKDAQTRTLQAAAWSGADATWVSQLCALVAQRVASKTTPEYPGEMAIRFAYRDGLMSELSLEGKGASSESEAGHTVTGLPILVNKTAVGMLLIVTPRSQSMEEEELRMLQEVTANLSFALQYQQRYRQARYFDVLTGLSKRSLFCERLGKALQSCGVLSRCAVAVLDIENLSSINDTLGRHAGDLLLQLVADRMKRRFGDTERLAHFGGGTFALIQPCPSAQQTCLDDLNTQIDGLFAQPFALEGKELPVSAKSGIAVYPTDGSEPEVLVQKAEATLRDAKLAHERHRYYSAEAHSASLAQVALERKLRVALERQQFELYYQPKVSVKTRRIVGVEALIRWNDPDRGVVSPAEFLPILESSGLIVEVGDWVIERAATDCRRWLQLGLPPVRIAVNISPVQLRMADFVTRFLKHVAEWTSKTSGLDIEITEGALGEGFAGEVSKLKMLQAAGIDIAVDDFGTGYSSLSRLADLPIDTLKIDRCFIAPMTTDARDRELVSSMMSIARAFQMRVVAEGVESPEQLETLWQMGCDHAQGYLHSRPATAEHLVKLLIEGDGRFLLPPDAAADSGQDASVTAA